MGTFFLVNRGRTPRYFLQCSQISFYYVYQIAGIVQNVVSRFYNACLQRHALNLVPEDILACKLTKG